MEVLEAIKTRRSIRHYKPDAISEEKLNTVLEALTRLVWELYTWATLMPRKLSRF